MYLSPAINEKPLITTAQLPWDLVASKYMHERILSPHETLFLEGDGAGFLYGVVEGVLSSYRVLSDGRRQVISFPYPGDLIGLGHSARYHFSCEAISSVRIRSIRKSAILHDSESHPRIGHRLLELANVELAKMQEHQVLLGRKSALEKTASFLLALARKGSRGTTQGPKFQLPMTRTDIADFLGITIETVSRNLSKLKANGVICLPRHNSVVVLDMQFLKALATGEDGASLPPCLK